VAPHPVGVPAWAGAAPAAGVGGAAESTLWREVVLLGGLLLMIVSQTLGGG